MEDAIHVALLALKESVDGELIGENLDIAVISDPQEQLLGFTGTNTPGPRFRKLSAEEINDTLILCKFTEKSTMAYKINTHIKKKRNTVEYKLSSIIENKY